jgi:hypothetical protein
MIIKSFKGVIIVITPLVVIKDTADCNCISDFSL